MWSGVAVGGCVLPPGGAAVAAPSPLAPDEHRRPGREQRLTRLDQGGLALGHDDRALALVVDARDLADRLQLALDRELAVERDALLAVHEHGRVERADLVEAPAHRGEHHRHRGEGPLGVARGVLGGELQLLEGVGGARPHAEGVDQGVLARPAAAGGFGPAADGVGVDGHRGTSSLGSRAVGRAGPLRPRRSPACWRWDGPWPRGRSPGGRARRGRRSGSRCSGRGASLRRPRASGRSRRRRAR